MRGPWRFWWRMRESAYVPPLWILPGSSGAVLWESTLTAFFLCAREAARRMVPRKRGVILMTASTNGTEGHPFYADYNASKAGVILLCKNHGSGAGSSHPGECGLPGLRAHSHAEGGIHSGDAGGHEPEDSYETSCRTGRSGGTFSPFWPLPRRRTLRGRKFPSMEEKPQDWRKRKNIIILVFRKVRIAGML